jgi:hypothetical protein
MSKTNLRSPLSAQTGWTDYERESLRKTIWDLLFEGCDIEGAVEEALTHTNPPETNTQAAVRELWLVYCATERVQGK